MKIIPLICTALLLCMSAYSQTDKKLLVLDNYKIPLNKKGVIIGKVIHTPNENIALIKDTSGLFILEKDDCIYLKDNISLNKSSPMAFGITIKHGDKEKAFTLVKEQFIRNGVIAHRGAWKNHDASQNSLNALKNAIEIGCEGSEFDVWLSSDNKVILSHDAEIGGKKVEETTAEELLSIPFKNNDFLPSLEQYIHCIKTQNKTRLVLEVKSSQKGKERSEAVADSSVQIVHRIQAQAWVDYITFNIDAAKRIREIDPTARILYLETDRDFEYLKASNISGIDYHYSRFFKDEGLATKARNAGLLTNVWTVNKEEDMKVLLNQGIDYITTDEPELLLRVLSEQ